MEFIRLIQPLIQVCKLPEISELGIFALVNLCSYSDDIKENFSNKDGLPLVLQLLQSKKESVLKAALRLVLVLIAGSDLNTRRLAECDNF